MPLESLKSGRGAGAQRRTVRIVRPRTLWRTASISLIVGLAAASIPVGVWYLLRSEQEPLARQRTLDDADMELQWRCAAGHVFHLAGHASDADGRTASRSCPTCGQPAYPSAYYTCPTHGVFEVAVRFAVGEGGVPTVSQVRPPGRGWLAPEVGLRCPKCDRPLVYDKDPLASINVGKRKSGG